MNFFIKLIRFVKERRQTISPNFNFLGQLYEYDKIILQSQNQNIPESFESDHEPVSEESCEKPKRDEHCDFMPSKAAQSFLKFNSKLKSPSSATPLNNLNQFIPTDLPEYGVIMIYFEILFTKNT